MHGSVGVGYRAELRAIAPYRTFVSCSGHLVHAFLAQQFRAAVMATTITSNVASTLSKKDVPAEIWLYGMVHHFYAMHAGSAPPSALCVKADTKEMVVNWSRK